MYKYLDETWDRGGLSWNKGITIDLIHKLVLPRATGDWNWYYISQFTSISDVYKYLDKPWDRRGLSKNKGVRIDLL